MVLGVDRIGMHCDFGEELVEETKETGVTAAQRLLDEGGI
jgi:hypothetical protein